MAMNPNPQPATIRETVKLLDTKARALRRLEVHATALTRYLVEAGWDPNDPRLNWPEY